MAEIRDVHIKVTVDSRQAVKELRRLRRRARRLVRPHWHLIGRHTHPEWHGHCDPSKRGYKRCDRPHWHLVWRHHHATPDSEMTLVGVAKGGDGVGGRTED